MDEGDYQDSFSNKKAKQIDRSRVSNEGMRREIAFKTKCGVIVHRYSIGNGQRWKHDNHEYELHLKNAIERNCGCVWTG